MTSIRASNKVLAERIDSLVPVLNAYNMITEATEIGLTINADCLDVETVRLVYLLKTKIREREEKKSAATAKGVGNRGR